MKTKAVALKRSLTFHSKGHEVDAINDRCFTDEQAEAEQSHPIHRWTVTKAFLRARLWARL